MSEKKQERVETTNESAEEKEKLLDFSVPKIAGGALAAATAAWVGSRLGVGGTIVGSAVTSLVIAVSTTVYSAGIHRTNQGVRSALKRGTARLKPMNADQIDDARTVEAATTVDNGSAPTSEAPALLHRRRRRFRIALASVGVTAIAVFAVSLALITFTEVTTGQSFDGKSRTTIGQLTQPESQETKTPEPSTTPTATTTAPQDETTDEPTSEPTTATTSTEAPATDEPTTQEPTKPATTTTTKAPNGAPAGTSTDSSDDSAANSRSQSTTDTSAG